MVRVLVAVRAACVAFTAVVWFWFLCDPPCAACSRAVRWGRVTLMFELAAAMPLSFVIRRTPGPD